MKSRRNLEDKRRTISQNRALHLYFEQLAEALNSSGLDMRLVLKEQILISWTKDNVKNYLWRPFQKALVKKHSTATLDKAKEIDIVYDNLHRHLVSKFGNLVEFPQFPSEEKLNMQENYAKRSL